MTEFISNNISTILILIVLLAVVALIIRGLVRDVKSGRSFCAMSATGTCGNCAHKKDGCTACSGCSFPKDIKIQKPYTTVKVSHQETFTRRVAAPGIPGPSFGVSGLRNVL